MNYRQKRYSAGLSVYTVARELGISYEKYLEVDRGARDLEGEYVDKFCEVLDRAKEINFNRMQKLRDIEGWITSGQIKEDITKMGYTQSSLARKIGVKQATINQIVNKRGDYSDDMKERIYDFLHDSINKNIEIEKPKVKPVEVISAEPTVTEITEDFIQTIEELPEVESIEVEVPEEETEEELEFEEEPSILRKLMEADTEEDYLDISLKSLKEENERLRRQIYLYEKLIERL